MIYLYTLGLILTMSCSGGSKKACAADCESDSEANSGSTSSGSQPVFGGEIVYNPDSTINDFQGKASSNDLTVLLTNSNLSCTTNQILVFNGSDWVCGNAASSLGTISNFSSTGITDNASAESIVIDGSGNVGIGISSPAEKLSVAGSIESTSGGFVFPDGSVQSSALKYVLLEEQTSAVVACTQGAWRVRNLDTEVADPAGIATLSSSQFTLVSGKYRCSYRAAAYQSEHHQTRLWNVTDSVAESWGTMQHSNDLDYTSNLSMGVAYIDISSSKTFQLEHRCAVTNAAGFALGQPWTGHSSSSSVECLRIGD